MAIPFQDHTTQCRLIKRPGARVAVRSKAMIWLAFHVRFKRLSSSLSYYKDSTKPIVPVPHSAPVRADSSSEGPFGRVGSLS